MPKSVFDSLYRSEVYGHSKKSDINMVSNIAIESVSSYSSPEVYSLTEGEHGVLKPATATTEGDFTCFNNTEAKKRFFITPFTQEKNAPTSALLKEGGTYLISVEIKANSKNGKLPNGSLLIIKSPIVPVETLYNRFKDQIKLIFKTSNTALNTLKSVVNTLLKAAIAIDAADEIISAEKDKYKQSITILINELPIRVSEPIQILKNNFLNYLGEKIIPPGYKKNNCDLELLNKSRNEELKNNIEKLCNELIVKYFKIISGLVSNIEKIDDSYTGANKEAKLANVFEPDLLPTPKFDNFETFQNKVLNISDIHSYSSIDEKVTIEYLLNAKSTLNDIVFGVVVAPHEKVCVSNFSLKQINIIANPKPCATGCVFIDGNPISSIDLKRENRLIQNVVGLSESQYLSVKSSLNVSNKSRCQFDTTDCDKASFGAGTWNQSSDRIYPARSKLNFTYNNVPSRGSSTKSSLTRARPGASKPGGNGVDIKHNSYARYLARRKANNIKVKNISDQEEKVKRERRVVNNKPFSLMPIQNINCYCPT